MPVAILCSDGAVQESDLRHICRTERWVPLLVHRPRGKPDEVPTLILFDCHDTARRFSRRNMPKEHLKGGVFLTPKEMAWVEKKGWKTEYLTWPRLLNSHPDLELGYEVLDFQTDPEVYSV